MSREHLPRSYLCHVAARALGGDADASQKHDPDCLFVCALCSPTLASELHYRCTGEGCHYCFPINNLECNGMLAVLSPATKTGFG